MTEEITWDVYPDKDTEIKTLRSIVLELQEDGARLLNDALEFIDKKDARIAELELAIKNEKMLHSIVYTMCEAQAQSISELKETVRRKMEEAQSFRAKMNEYKLSCTMIEESYKDLDIEFTKLINPSSNRFVIDLDLDQTHFILMSIASYREDLKKMDNTEFKAIQGIYKQIQLRFQFIHSLLEGNNLESAINKLEK